jgi:hypothetical protein
VQSLAVGEAKPTPESLWDDHDEHDDRNNEETNEDGCFPDDHRDFLQSVIVEATIARLTQMKTVPNRIADTAKANSM